MTMQKYRRYAIPYDFIKLEGFSVDGVTSINRKRIALVKETLRTLNELQRKNIFNYISEYCPDLKCDVNSFLVRNNEDLSLVLFGIDQRFYTGPLDDEKRIANSIIKMR